MTALASGGKVWQVPVPHSEEDAKFGVLEWVKGISFMLVGFSALVGGTYLLFQGAMGGTAYIDAANSVPGALPKIVSSSSDDSIFRMLVSLIGTFAVSMFSFGFAVKTGIFRRLHLSLTVFTTVSLMIVFLVQIVTIITFSSGSTNGAADKIMGDWVKEHYGVTLLCPVSPFESTVEVGKSDGNTTKLNILHVNDQMYLYETKEELVSLVDSLR